MKYPVVLALATALAAAGAGCGERISSNDGAAIFAEACARCHGPQGVPDPGNVARLGVKNLTDPELQGRMSDDEIAAQIRHGSKNQQMPAFQGALTDPQIHAVISHVRALRAGATAAQP